MASSGAQAQQHTNRLVFKNTLLLVGAKVLATPISIASTAIVARYLGPTDYSYIYLATTYVSFATLFVVFGQSGALPALVAVERSRAGEFLGSALLWRGSAGVLVYVVLAGACWLVGYDLTFHQTLAFVFLTFLISYFAGACLETIRAFDRTDIDAMVNVGRPLVSAAITIPVVLLGGRLLSVLTVDVFVAAAVVILVALSLRRVGIARMVTSMAALKTLLSRGAPFLFFSAALALQPVVDAAFLSRLAPAEVVGWHAAAYKLIGLVVFPASALITALYPVLCRLYVENPKSYIETTRSTLQTSVLFTVPVALFCGLFPELGVMVFGKAGYGPVIDNLRVFSVYVFLVYVSMPLGSAVLAAGKARPWSIVQASCVIIVAVLDPLFIPWFQETRGNGGLGICTSSVVVEVFMVAMALWMLPKGVLQLKLLRPVASAIGGGIAMALVAVGLARLSPFVTAPLAGIAYVAVLWVTGALNKEQLQFLRSAVSRKKQAS